MTGIHAFKIGGMRALNSMEFEKMIKHNKKISELHLIKNLDF